MKEASLTGLHILLTLCLIVKILQYLTQCPLLRCFFILLLLKQDPGAQFIQLEMQRLALPSFLEFAFYSHKCPSYN